MGCEGSILMRSDQQFACHEKWKPESDQKFFFRAEKVTVAYFSPCFHEIHVMRLLIGE